MRRLLPVIALFLLAACSSSAPAKVPELNAQVGRGPLSVTVYNHDSFAWQSVRVQLNPALLRDNYEITVPSIPAGGSSEIPLVNFSNSEGRRFDPLTMIVKEVWLSVPTAQGTAYWTGTWN